ncbi:hypothetical protein D3C80_1835030 [compost metagenome]
MANGDGQGIRGVDLRLAGEFEHVHDHHLHLLFIRPAGPSHRLLDLGGAVFGNFQAFFCPGNNGRATCLP